MSLHELETKFSQKLTTAPSNHKMSNSHLEDLQTGVNLLAKTIMAKGPAVEKRRRHEINR